MPEKAVQPKKDESPATVQSRASIPYYSLLFYMTEIIYKSK